MQLTPLQWGAVVAAAVAIAWPRIAPHLTRLVAPAAGAPRPAAGGRPSIIVDVLNLQDAARREGNTRAADLLGQAAVALIGAADGGKK